MTSLMQCQELFSLASSTEAPPVHLLEAVQGHHHLCTEKKKRNIIKSSSIHNYSRCSSKYIGEGGLIWKLRKFTMWGLGNSLNTVLICYKQELV